MNSRAYIVKARQRLSRLTRRYRRPVSVPSIDLFFRKHWQGELPKLDYPATRREPRFFFHPSDYQTYRELLQRQFPDACQRVTQRADGAVKHWFDLLGSGETYLGEKIDWHVDFKSGIGWDNLPYARVRTVDLNDKADVKIPWELSRLQHLTDLGRAYWLTSDGVYLNEFVSTINHWEKSNPVDRGVNWSCPMEVAIRAINIIWGLYFFSINGGLNDDFVRRVIRLLYYHGRHIEKNLEFIASGSNSNHLLSNYLGLFYIGLLFPEFDRSLTWRQTACRGLEAEMMLQVFPDGADYECSTSYHRLVLEIFLSAHILGERNDINFSGEYRDRLERMIDYSTAITAPSGRAPLLGDNDDGFIVKLSTDDPSCHRQLIETGCLSLNRPLPDASAMSEERLWYLGPQALNLPVKTKRTSSVHFKDSGYAVIRNNDLHLLFNAGRVTDKHFAGHKHNDNLSFTLEIDGRPYLIDPGTYCYTSDYRMRNRGRSTAGHNTVMVDDEEQSRFLEKRLFHMFNDARPKIDLWINMNNLAVISAMHRGYTRLNDRITHRRTIWAFLDIRALTVMDEFEGKSGQEHQFATRYFTPVADVRRLDESMIRLRHDDRHALNVSFVNQNRGELSIETGEYYPRYGVKAPAQMIQCVHRSGLPFKNMVLMSDGAVPVDWQQRLHETAHRFKSHLADIALRK